MECIDLAVFTAVQILLDIRRQCKHGAKFNEQGDLGQLGPAGVDFTLLGGHPGVSGYLT